MERDKRFCLKLFVIKKNGLFVLSSFLSFISDPAYPFLNFALYQSMCGLEQSSIFMEYPYTTPLKLAGIGSTVYILINFKATFIGSFLQCIVNAIEDPTIKQTLSQHRLLYDHKGVNYCVFR